MANSRYEYVRLFEQPDILLANTWIVVRIDGRGFSKFTTKYNFTKPNDKNGIDVMNAAAKAVMQEIPDLVMAFGNSDEYSFVFHKDLTTTIVSTFTSYYVYSWAKYFPQKPLTPPLPSFDGRAVCYPSNTNLRDYMSWRQVDCHINNLYNTTFWALVQQGGMGHREAEERLKGTVSSDKNEILFKEKGTVLYRDVIANPMFSEFPTPPLAQPKPTRVSKDQLSKSIEKAVTTLPELDTSVASPDSCSRPTFLSTTSTPSPPPSPPHMSRAAFPNPLRSNPISTRSSANVPDSSFPLSPPSTATWASKPQCNGKQPLPSLTPLPLSPPTLKPSTKPPMSLNAPNPTTRTNFSPTTPQHDFPADFPIAGYRHKTSLSVNRGISHSASASLTTAQLPQDQHPGLKRRSPSQPSLPTYFDTAARSQTGPPFIPLRMSSIPANNKPRKLSLPVHRSSSTLRATRGTDEKESGASPNEAVSTPLRRVSPPMQKNKALPSPPMSAEEETRTREKVMASSPKHDWNNYSMVYNAAEQPIRRASGSESQAGRAWTSEQAPHPGIPNSRHLNPTPTLRLQHHKIPPHIRVPPIPHPTPDMHTLISSTAAPSPPKSQPYATTQPFPAATPPCPPHQSPPALTKPKNKDTTPESKRKEGKRGTTTSGGDEGRPVNMSRSQRDKDRKKRSKAAISWNMWIYQG
ncbi:tRNAHis guanylyltransferase-domain-containing protein [Bipolaris maydis]|nr:tRNAHis guanylyltransferase-domain-containing protein [Bipolaris maydis]